MTATDPGLRPAAVLAVDGGNSKTEVVLLDRRGDVVGVARGPGSNHSHSDHQTVMQLIDMLIGRAADKLRPEIEPAKRAAAIADAAVLCLAGADYAGDDRALAASAAPFGWADPLLIRNDAVGMLRAGTDNDVGIALVCGAGVNCVGHGPGGRTVQFPALGEISGDWGGGYDIGMAAVVAAVRAEDGRGPRTVLADRVPRYFGLAKPASLVHAVHTGRIAMDRVVELPPLVFAAADDGDEVAGSIVDRLGDELVVMASATLRRLRVTRTDVDVVLGGGILTSGYPRLLERVTTGIAAVAPHARLVALATPPVAGAALLGFDALGVVPVSDVRAVVCDALRTEERR